jgi:hypothetical protein
MRRVYEQRLAVRVATEKGYGRRSRRVAHWRGASPRRQAGAGRFGAARRPRVRSRAPATTIAAISPSAFRKTNRIIKLPATTATEIESLHFGKMRNFPARAWHVRAHLKSVGGERYQVDLNIGGVALPSSSINRGDIARLGPVKPAGPVEVKDRRGR